MNPALQFAFAIPAALALLAVVVLFAVMQNPALGIGVVNEMDKRHRKK